MFITTWIPRNLHERHWFIGFCFTEIVYANCFCRTTARFTNRENESDIHGSWQYFAFHINMNWTQVCVRCHTELDLPQDHHIFFYRETESLRNSTLILFKQLIPPKDIVLSSLHLLIHMNHLPCEVRGMLACQWAVRSVYVVAKKDRLRLARDFQLQWCDQEGGTLGCLLYTSPSPRDA